MLTGGGSVASRCSTSRAQVRARLLPARGRIGPSRSGVVAALAAALLVLLGAWPVAPVPPLVARLLQRRRATRRRHDELRARRRALPDLVDLLRLAVESGATPRRALEQVDGHVPAPLAAPVGSAVAGLRAGQPLAEVLDGLVLVLGPELRPLASVLRAAALDGAPLAPALDRLGDELRATRRREAEADARRLPVRLLFPLVCCSLPSIVLLSVVPLLVTTVGSLHP